MFEEPLSIFTSTVSFQKSGSISEFIRLDCIILSNTQLIRLFSEISFVPRVYPYRVIFFDH